MVVFVVGPSDLFRSMELAAFVVVTLAPETEPAAVDC